MNEEYIATGVIGVVLAGCTKNFNNLNVPSKLDDNNQYEYVDDEKETLKKIENQNYSKNFQKVSRK